jgi:proline dehydrogenase
MAFFFLARRFVAGLDVPSALDAVRRLNEQGILATLDILGENVNEPQHAVRAADAYVALLEEIARAGVGANVSLKLTQMGLDISPELCEENLRRILVQAATCGNFVRIDMEGSAYTQRTLDLFFRVFADYPNVGVVVQAYLHRSEADVRRLIVARARVRLCKGAYKEPPTIAYRRMSDIRRNFLHLAEMLLRDGNYPAIATHDDLLLNAVKAWTTEHRVPPHCFEFQMLYGIRPRTQQELVRQGYTLRVYVPFGTEWFPYFSRRLRERKENIWFVVANLFKK